ncbi:hypothetical protein [uncultured Croceitalea sp.]|uniref:hypothetical protein n=1 Tax=uncultured Croceitalea sp. TaxID=1798908 RepID=UPI00330579B7
MKQTKDFINRVCTQNIVGARRMVQLRYCSRKWWNKPISGKHHNRDGFLENFGRLPEVTGGSYKMTKEFNWVEMVTIGQF